MPYLNWNEEIDFPGEHPGNVESFCQDVLPEGSYQGRFSVEAGIRGFDLCPLEMQVIALTVAGYSHEERANILGISVPAVRLHLLKLRNKLDVACELELVLFALYYQLVDTHEVSPSCDQESPAPV